MREQADAFGETGGTLRGQELQDVVQEFRLGAVGGLEVWFSWIYRCFPDATPVNRFPKTDNQQTQLYGPTLLSFQR
jgi:hypothetical protein